MAFNYPKFAMAMEMYEGAEFTREEIKDADQELFEINQAYYTEKEMYEQGLHPEGKSLQQIEYEHEMYLQDFWEDTFGEDTWDDRHEIYSLQE